MSLYGTVHTGALEVLFLVTPTLMELDALSMHTLLQLAEYNHYTAAVHVGTEVGRLGLFWFQGCKIPCCLLNPLTIRSEISRN